MQVVEHSAFFHHTTFASLAETPWAATKQQLLGSKCNEQMEVR